MANLGTMDIMAADPNNAATVIDSITKGLASIVEAAGIGRGGSTSAPPPQQPAPQTAMALPQWVIPVGALGLGALVLVTLAGRR